MEEVEIWLINNGFTKHHPLIDNYDKIYFRTSENRDKNITFKVYISDNDVFWECYVTEQYENSFIYEDIFDNIKEHIAIWFKDVERNNVIDDLLSPS